MAHILVTGGAGYIGSHAAYACIDRGHRVTVFDNLSTGVARNVPPQAELVEADLEDVGLLGRVLREGQVDAIMHFAGSIVVPESVINPGLYYQNNTIKSLGLIQAAIAAHVKAFIFSSTAAVYAPGTSTPLSEDAIKAPLSPYGQSKLMTETMLADMSTAHGLSVGVLRYFNVAGADPQGRTGQSTPNATHLIKVACQVATGQRPSIEVFGTDYDTADGTCIRDYIHVSDLADAHVLLVDHLLGGGANITANCGYGKGASVLDVLRALEAQLDATIPVKMSPRRAGDAPSLVANADLLKKTLPWKPKFEKLSDIVGAALAWERHLIQGARDT